MTIVLSFRMQLQKMPVEIGWNMLLEIDVTLHMHTGPDKKHVISQPVLTSVDGDSTVSHV
jgi:hypothetical protein